MTPYGPPGLPLRVHNRLILAERLHWPADAPAACWELERRYPGWAVAWLGECTWAGHERPAGYWAVLDGMHSAEVFSPDLAGLEELMQAVPDHDYSLRGCLWCADRGEERLRRAGL